MTTYTTLRRSASALTLAALCLPLAARAQTMTPPSDHAPDDILVIAQQRTATIEGAPSTRASLTAAQIADTVNAMNVEDTLKYLPSLLIRKRHVGDTQAPIATRTSGLGSSARSLIYADGVLISALIGNNNSSASPRWGLVSPEEIARIDVLYGPFAAAYAGNSIGGVVNITTRLPDRLEATLSAGTSVQTYDQYATHGTFPAYQFAATLGDRIGPLALFASMTRTTSDSQPTAFVTALSTRAATPAGVSATGGFEDLNRTAQPIRLFGATGLEHQVQDTIKLKAALDLTSAVRLTYVGGLFRNDTDATAATYLTRDDDGEPIYASPGSPAAPLNIAGYAYSIPPSAFSNGVYRYDERHWSHALSATGSGHGFDWQVIGTLYDFAKDIQRTPTAPLPSAFAGGAGNITKLDGTGWQTIDAKGLWRPGNSGAHTLSAGLHVDRFTLNSNRYSTTDWIAADIGALNQSSRGKTRAVAIWGQDAVNATGPLTLTIGGRYEWWRAYDATNFSLSPALSTRQPVRTAQGFSPKAALSYAAAHDWTVRLSLGRAYRFPTVGELYQVVTTGTVLTVPDPTLRPERAWSQELAIEHACRTGSARLSVFNEWIDDALIAQSAPLVPGSATLYTYVQNVDRTRARGIEAAAGWRDVASTRVDLSGSVTYTDATTVRNAVFPASIGKLLPSVPRWKATAVATWRPDETVALTAAARYASRNYGTLDNSDTIGNTYQGFYRYLVIDLRAKFDVTPRYSFAIGVDNVNNDRYFLFHPFPQRSFSAEVTMKL